MEKKNFSFAMADELLRERIVTLNVKDVSTFMDFTKMSVKHRGSADQVAKELDEFLGDKAQDFARFAWRLLRSETSVSVDDEDDDDDDDDLDLDLDGDDDDVDIDDDDDDLDDSTVEKVIVMSRQMKAAAASTRRDNPMLDQPLGSAASKKGADARQVDTSKKARRDNPLLDEPLGGAKNREKESKKRESRTSELLDRPLGASKKDSAKNQARLSALLDQPLGGCNTKQKGKSSSNDSPSGTVRFSVTMGDDSRKRTRYGNHVDSDDDSDTNGRYDDRHDDDDSDELGPKRQRTAGASSSSDMTCKNFPNCPYGASCRYVHPSVACKFGAHCLRPNCAFTHPPPAAMAAALGRRGSGGGGAPPCRNGFACADRASGTCSFQHPDVACRFGKQCSRGNTCKFSHAMVCRYAKACTRAGCSFAHPADALAPLSEPEVEQADQHSQEISESLPSTP
jgi:RNA-binding, Nab2-type zinc finger